MPAENKSHQTNDNKPAAKAVQPSSQPQEGAQPEQLPSILQRAAVDARAISPANASRLQRAIGNQALGRLISGLSGSGGGSTKAQTLDSMIHAQRSSQHEPQHPQPAPKSVGGSGPSRQDGMVQRHAEEEIQMKADGSSQGGELDGDLESAVNRARSGGDSLDESLRQPMESAFGADFGGVRIHTGADADTLNRSVQARAFTTGRDIFFRSGEYRPASSSGQELIAHELTHVVQQNGSGPVQRHFMPIPGYEEEEPKLQRKPVAGISRLSPRVQREVGDEEIAAMREQERLELTDFIPATRSGHFDVVLNPQTGAMRVIVRLHLDLLSYGDKQWTQGTADAWILSLQNGVAGTWNNKVALHLQRPGHDAPDLVVNPTFEVAASYSLNDHIARPDEPVNKKADADAMQGPGAPVIGGDTDNASLARAHFNVLTTRGPLDDYKAKSQEMGFKHPLVNRVQKGAKSANVNSTPMTERSLGQDGDRPQGTSVLHFDDTDFMTHNNFFMQQIEKGERTIYKTLIGDAGIEVNFKAKARGTGDIGARSTVRLDTFIRRWKSMYPPTTLKWPLIIEGGNAGKRTKVKNYLEAAGIDNRFVLQAGGRQLRLKFQDDYQVTAQDDVGSQMTAAHEFGHMLGLPDDYVGLNSEVSPRLENYTFTDPESGVDINMDKEMNDAFSTGGESKDYQVEKQNAMLDICANAGVPVPTTFGLNHNTLMGNGDEFLPHHFVTVWDAVGQATADYTEPGWWKIVML